MFQTLSGVTEKLRLARRFIPIYLATLLLFFHTFVIGYLNSSFLDTFLSTKNVSLIYIVSSALTVGLFLLISKVLNRIGNIKVTLALLVLDFLAVFGLAFSAASEVVIPLMIIHLIAVPLIIFNLDVFMEEHIGNDEGVTGTRRGLLLTMMGIIGALSPVTSAALVTVGGGDFTFAYLASALALVPIIMLLITFFKDFKDPPYSDLQIFQAIRSFWINPPIRAVFIVHFVLQVFFMLVVVFVPLYLVGQIGLTWAEFGIIMIFAQLAYVLFEYPIGIIADNYIGEKEMMAFGLMILALSTGWIAFVTEPNIVLWSIIMFITRVGASFVEVTTEVHFFKKTKSSDAQIISFFRVTRPLAYLVGAIIASVSLFYLPFNLLFIVVACLMIPTMFMVFDIEDTK